jgi:hypothetical protein
MRNNINKNKSSNEEGEFIILLEGLLGAAVGGWMQDTFFLPFTSTPLFRGNLNISPPQCHIYYYFQLKHFLEGDLLSP